MSKITVIGVPSSAGARRAGQDRAPYSFRKAGLTEGLAAGGFEVNEVYLDQVTFRPDPDGVLAQRLVEAVVKILIEARSSWK